MQKVKLAFLAVLKISSNCYSATKNNGAERLSADILTLRISTIYKFGVKPN